VDGYVVFGGGLGHQVRVSQLDLERQGVGSARQFADPLWVVEASDDLVADDGAGRTAGRRVQYDDIDAERRDRFTDHATQLAAADDAERGSRQSDRHSRRYRMLVHKYSHIEQRNTHIRGQTASEKDPLRL